MKSENVVYTMTATGLFPCLISIPWATAEITPPSDNVDPGSETPTNPSLGMEITSFTMETISTDIRGYAEDGTWDQDSEDITKEYTGIDPSSADDDDTSEEEDEGNDSPGFEISLIAGVIMITTIIHDSQKEKEQICKDSFPSQLKWGERT